MKNIYFYFVFLIILSSFCLGAEMDNVNPYNLISNNINLQNNSNNTFSLYNLSGAWIHSTNASLYSFVNVENPYLSLQYSNGYVWGAEGNLTGNKVILRWFYERDIDKNLFIQPNKIEHISIKIPKKAIVINSLMNITGCKNTEYAIDSFETGLDDWVFVGDKTGNPDYEVHENNSVWASTGTKSLEIKGSSDTTLNPQIAYEKYINADITKHVLFDFKINDTEMFNEYVAFAINNVRVTDWLATSGIITDYQLNLTGYTGNTTIAIVVGRYNLGWSMGHVHIDNIRYIRDCVYDFFITSQDNPISYDLNQTDRETNKYITGTATKGYDNNFETYAEVDNCAKVNITEYWAYNNEQYYRINYEKNEDPFTISFYNFTSKEYKIINYTSLYNNGELYPISLDFINVTNNMKVNINYLTKSWGCQGRVGALKNNYFFESEMGNFTAIDISLNHVLLDIEIGSDDKNPEINLSGNLYSSTQTDNLTNAINTYLSTCKTYDGINCKVPFNITSNGTKYLTFEALQLNYTIPKYFNFTTVLRDITDLGYGEIGLNFTSTSEGNINLSKINITYHTRPQINFNSPIGNQPVRSSIDLETNISFNEYLNKTCRYRLQGLNNEIIIPNTSFNCISNNFGVTYDGSYIMFVYANDTYGADNEISQRFDVFTNIYSQPSTVGGGIKLIEEGTEAILDFGMTYKSITVVNPPSKITDYIKVKNIGNANIDVSEFKLSDEIKPYLQMQLCDIDKKNCKDSFSLEAGESAFIKIQGDFPYNFGDQKEGLLTVVGEDNFELPLQLSRLPLYFYFDPLVSLVYSIVPIYELATLVVFSVHFLLLLLVFGKLGGLLA